MPEEERGRPAKRAVPERQPPRMGEALRHER